MESNQQYKVIIIGGGLAGLSLAIQLAQENRSVLLIEKGAYPRHKVCGEYISLESWAYVQRLGVPLEAMNLPKIDKLKISSENGVVLKSDLDLGGFGISRYVLEDLLYKKCKELGVEVLTNTKYVSHLKERELFKIKTSRGVFEAEVLCASFGKYAPNDLYKPQKKTDNWVGVKYHIRFDHPSDEIVLHNFENGYCGMSKIEDGKSCLCYLVNAKELKKCGNDIKALEEKVLQQNTYLNTLFRKAEFLYKKPMVISNVSFEVKKPVHNGIFYLGDSAGTIAPLSGNGMSNAFRSAYLLNKSLNSYFKNEISLAACAQNYEKDWLIAFKSRISTGSMLQQFFCKKNLNAASIRILKYAKPIHKYIIRKTHGLPF